MTWEMERVTQLVIAGSSISLDRPIHLRMYSTCGGCLYEATAQALLRCNLPLSNLSNNICWVRASGARVRALSHRNPS